jgi:hypothetical protein
VTESGGMTKGSRVVLRVAPATVLIFGLLFSPAMFVAGILVWRGEQVREAVALCALYAVMLYWACGRTVELAPGRLIYRALFTRRTIDLGSVEDVRIAARPAPVLELRRRGSRDHVPAFIVKPFSTTGVAAILRHVRGSSPEANRAGRRGGQARHAHARGAEGGQPASTRAAGRGGGCGGSGDPDAASLTAPCLESGM